MALTTAVTRKMDNNYVQVEVSGRRIDTRYYRVPEDRADSFQSEYVKNSKKAGWITNGLMVLGVVAMTTASYFITKKMANSGLKTLSGFVMGVTGGIAGTAIGAKAEMNSHEKLLYKYNASELNYYSQNPQTK